MKRNGMVPQWDRILQVMFYCGEIKIETFARRIGLKSGYTLHHIKRGSGAVTQKLADGIVRAVPEIDQEWLMFGTGSMLKPNSEAGH